MEAAAARSRSPVGRRRAVQGRGRALERMEMSGVESDSRESEGSAALTSGDEGSTASVQQEYERSAVLKAAKDRKEEREKEKLEGITAQIPVDILWRIMPVCLKEPGATTRNIIMFLGAMLRVCDIPLEKVILSMGAFQKYKDQTAEKVGSEAIEKFAERVNEIGAPIVAHFDGKLMPQDFGGRQEIKNRLVTTLTSPFMEHDQLVDAAPMDDSSGYEEAAQVHLAVEGLGLVRHTIGAVGDTCIVNMGQEDGAMQHLQRMMQKPILEIPCGHHVEELPAKEVMKAVSGRESTAPTDPLFVTWKGQWNDVKEEMDNNNDFFYNCFDWAANENTATGTVATEVKKWAVQAKNDLTFGRGDYTTALDYMLAFFGVKGNFTMARPCAVSKARFLQVGLYYLQMHLLLNLKKVREILTADEIKEVETMAEYVALHYLPYMLQAKFGASAPRNLLTAIQRLRAVRDECPLVADTALKKREAHLNWVSPELAAFSLFDDQLPPEERQAAATKLLTYLHQWVPGERLIYQLSVPGRGHFCTGDEYFVGGDRPKVEEFINGRSYLLWEVLEMTHENTNWMETPVNEWPKDEYYRLLHHVVTQMTVVNDPAERMIRLVSERISKVRSEDRLQDHLLTIVELQRLARDFHRGHFSKEQLESVLDKLLRCNNPQEEEMEGQEEEREDEMDE